MLSLKTYSLLTWLYTQKVESGYAILYFRITINSKRANISLNKKIEISKWDADKSKAKGNSSEARILNQFLKKEEAKIAKAYQDLEYEGKLITSQLLKSRYLGTDQKHKSLLDLIKYHNDSIEKKIDENTLKNYKTSQRYLMSFVSKQFSSNDIYLKELNYPFIVDYETFLRNYQPTNGQKRIQNNTVMKHIQRLRKLAKLAYQLEWIPRDPFAKYSPSWENKEREYLSQFELNKIIEFSTHIERLQLVKDLFLFSCYTGLAYVDIRKLSSENIAKGIDGNTWIITKRQKTKTSVRIPLLGPAEMILKTYAKNLRVLHSDKLLPGISNQKVNSYLKEIADVCGISKNLTFHMARHTFATTVTLTNGIPIETVSKMLGHTKLSTTQIYAKILDIKVSNDMKVLHEKLSKQKLKGEMKSKNVS